MGNHISGKIQLKDKSKLKDISFALPVRIITIFSDGILREVPVSYLKNIKNGKENDKS